MNILAKLGGNVNPPPPKPLALGIYDRFEQILDAFGLMRGSWAPVKRFTFGFGIATIFVMWLKPRYAFYRGVLRSWKPLGDNSEAPSTWTPWWVPGLATGFVFALFI